MLAGSNRGCLDGLLSFMARRLLGVIELGGQFPTEAGVSLVQPQKEVFFIRIVSPDSIPRITGGTALEKLPFAAPRNERPAQTFSQHQGPFAGRFLSCRLLFGRHEGRSPVVLGITKRREQIGEGIGILDFVLRLQALAKPLQGDRNPPVALAPLPCEFSLPALAVAVLDP